MCAWRAEIIEAVRALALIPKDDVIPSMLNRKGLVAGSSNHWIRQRVTAMRGSYRIAVLLRLPEDCIDPWHNLTQAARRFGVTAKTLRLAARRGEIAAAHPLDDGPWIFHRADLEGAMAVKLRPRARIAEYPINRIDELLRSRWQPKGSAQASTEKAA